MRFGIALAGLLTVFAFTPASAQKKPPSAPATTTITGSISVDPSCDLLGTVVYVPGRALLARLGISTDYTADGRPVSTFRIDNVPVSVTAVNVEVPGANFPVIAAAFTATTSVTQVNITYPGTCTNALPRACTLSSQCNDGNACTTDACGANNRCTSTPRTCNDGDPGTNDTCNPASGCVFTPNVCGDGTIAGGEACDDGNTASGDGCSGACQFEVGYICAGEPSVCINTCGPLATPPPCLEYVQIPGGCALQPKPNGTACLDSDATPGSCQNGICELLP